MTDTSDDWFVEIRPYTEDESDPGFRRMKAHSERDADKIDRGVNINLNHEKYYTRVVKAPKRGEETPAA